MKQLIKNNPKTVLIIVLTFFFLSTFALLFNNYKLKEEKKYRDVAIVLNLLTFDEVAEKMLNLQKSIVAEKDTIKLEELLRTWEYAEDTFTLTLFLTGGNFLTDELSEEYRSIQRNLMVSVQSFTKATKQEEREEIMNNTQEIVKELNQFTDQLMEEFDVNLEEEHK